MLVGAFTLPTQEPTKYTFYPSSSCDVRASATWKSTCCRACWADGASHIWKSTCCRAGWADGASYACLAPLGLDVGSRVGVARLLGSVSQTGCSWHGRAHVLRRCIYDACRSARCGVVLVARCGAHVGISVECKSRTSRQDAAGWPIGHEPAMARAQDVRRRRSGT